MGIADLRDFWSEARMRPVQKSSRWKGALAAVVLAGAVAAAALRLRRWQLRWGAADEEIAMHLDGDDIVKSPDHESTRAITINAAPEDIWPWLVQIGKGRGGLYSYDSLDIAFKMLDEPSVERVLPEFQCIKAGDVLPIGRDDTTRDDFYVHFAEPNRALVLGANDASFRDRVSWAMVLLPLSSEVTRLVVRIRYEKEPGLKGLAIAAAMDLTSFIMLRKQMLTFKRLAERHRAERVKAS